MSLPSERSSERPPACKPQAKQSPKEAAFFISPIELTQRHELYNLLRTVINITVMWITDCAVEHASPLSSGCQNVLPGVLWFQYSDFP